MMCLRELQSEIRHLRCMIDSARILSVGKYKGCTFAQIRRRDFDYCDWILSLARDDIALEIKHFQNWLRSTCSVTLIPPPATLLGDASANLERFVSPPLKYEAELAGLF